MLLDGHVEFAPDHVHEQFYLPGRHQLSEQVSRHLEPVRVEEYERRRHFLPVLTEVPEGIGEDLVRIAVAQFHVNAIG